MKGQACQLVKLTGTSTTSLEEAVDKVVREAHETIRNLCWLQGVEKPGDRHEGKEDRWHVTIKVGFPVEDRT